MRKFAAIVFLSCAAFAQDPLRHRDPLTPSGSVPPPTLIGKYTIGTPGAGQVSLPAASSYSGYLATVVDCESTSACSTGGGNVPAWLRSNGVTWSLSPVYCSPTVTTNCVPNADSNGNIAISSTLSAARVSILRTANGAIAAHSLVKGVASGKVGPVASDTEGIVGVAEQAATLDGDQIWVTELGLTTILCESATDLNYLVAGTDPTKVKDAGQSTLNALTLSTRIVAKAMGACSGGVVTANLIGPYRFGASPLPAVVVADGSTVTCPLAPAITAGGFYVNNTSGACTLTLPAITAPYVGARFCFRNASTRTGIITFTAPASTTIDNAGAATAAEGSVASAGALGDSGCAVAISTTQYLLYVGGGTWQ